MPFVSYQRQTSSAECCDSFLVNNWQYLVFVLALTIFIVIQVLFALGVIPVQELAALINETLLQLGIAIGALCPSPPSTLCTILTVIAPVIAGAIIQLIPALLLLPLGLSLFAIGDIYRSLFNYQTLFLKVSSRGQDGEEASFTNRFLSNTAGKQAFLVASVGLLSYSLAWAASKILLTAAV